MGKTFYRRMVLGYKMTEALLRGIPVPAVYASELQTGELLILDKSDKYNSPTLQL